MKAELIDWMGDDTRVVNAARVSFSKESEPEYLDELGNVVDKDYASNDDGNITRLKDKDAKLIAYLAKHNHWTPFSHAMVTLRETVPIFVARQRFKHMVGFTYNEVSRRYVDDNPEFFIPEVWRGRPQGSIKQGSSEEEIRQIPLHSDKGMRPPMRYIPPDKWYKKFIDDAQHLYRMMVEGGVAPEQARMVLPQSMYTSYYVTGSLAAWARAYKLRIDPHAQKEIQDLAKQWDEIISPLFPVSWKALTNGEETKGL